LLNRKKHGFGVPLGQWFRHQLRSYAEDTLLSPQARVRSYFEPEYIRTMFQAHVEGRQQHGDRLWVLLTFELWLRMLEDGTLWTPRQAEADDGIDVTQVTQHSYA
jgi:asparagine synthase (glutamine-hydrolysing)